MAPDPTSSGAARSAGSISLSFSQLNAQSKSHDQSQRAGGRLIRAPVDSDDEAEHHSRSYRTASYRVPDSSSDESDGEEVESAPQGVWPSPNHSPEMDVLRWVQEGQVVRYMAASQRTLCELQRQLMAVDLDVMQELDEWEQLTKKKQEDMVRAEQDRLLQREQEREKCLRELSKSQQKTAELQQLQLQKVQAEVEAARRAKLEAERKAAEELRRKKEEEERKKKLEQERKEQEERQKAEAAKKAEAAEAAAKAAEAHKAAQASLPVPSTTSRSKAASGLCISDSAAAHEARVMEQTKKTEAVAEAFKKASGTQWRQLDKTINKHVLQISATQHQVIRKSQEMVSLLRGCSSDDMRSFACLSLSSKLLKQCEVQVQQLPSFAFPLGLVTVNVATQVPQFMDVLLGQLYQVCVLAVPKYYVFKKGNESDVEYFKHMGYRDLGEDGEQKMESTDQFLDRMKGYILYYAAITQVDNPANPHGIEQAWSFLARLLNSLPSNRITATIIDSFLKVAGYRMHWRFRGQFVKLLQYISQHFLQELQRKHDPELSAVTSRISTYLSLQQYLQEPEGMKMPQQDESEYNRA